MKQTKKSVKRTSDPLNQDIDDENLSGFERFELEAKSTIFNVLYVLLKDEETVAWKKVVLSLIDFFQIFQFTFFPAVSLPSLKARHR